MIEAYLKRWVRPVPNSHKGENGRLLIIGGSDLFHAPLLWGAVIASKVVDMVHVTSPYLLNSQLMETKLKERFWDGMVVPWEAVDEYLNEDEAVLIGPGMTRSQLTQEISDKLLKRYPEKKWVVDGGALQTVDPDLLNGNMIITPHKREWAGLRDKHQTPNTKHQETNELIRFSKNHNNLTILLKGPVDAVVQNEEIVMIEGGNEGMTKGGTGDVLAGLTAALATKNEPMVAAVIASLVNKRAGEALYARVGNYFNATDLVGEIPHVLQELVNK